MDLEKLTEAFLVDENVSPERLGQLIERLLPYCVVRKDGSVQIAATQLSGKDQVKLVLVARHVASRIRESGLSDEVSAEDISRYTGLPKNQAAARAKECTDERFAERSARGSYRARQHKIDGFLGQLPPVRLSKEGR